MAFLNIPLKAIQGNISSVIGVATMPWYNPGDFPVIPPNPQPIPTQVDHRWEITMNVDVQSHSSYLTRDPGLYNGMDIDVGMWIANATSGQAWQIISIESKSATSVIAIVQDIYRYNTFRNNPAPNVGTYVVFNIGDTGVPEIDPVPPSGVSSTFGINIQSRFQYINLQYDYPLYQEGNTFAYNDTIAADPINHRFTLSDATNRMVIGRVTSISDTIPGWFTINPVQKIVDYLDYLPGDVGDVIYASLTIPGEITIIPGGSELYIKLRNNTSSTSISTASGPALTPQSVFQLNDIDILIAQYPYGINDVVTAVNFQTSLTGVTASTVLSPSIVQTTNTLFYGELLLWVTGGPYATATINGILVTFNIASTDPGEYSDYARGSQMAQVINAAGIPNIVASTTNAQTLIITNTAGGPITIINGTLDINSVPFADLNSGSGLALVTPASITPVIKFIATDARAIDFLDVVGTAVEDFGLISVENGIKACGLYIEEGLRTASLTVVTNLTQLHAMNPLIGDQTYVIDSVDTQGNNSDEWSLWLFNGTIWIETSNQDSSTTDAKSLEYTLTTTSLPSINIGSISTGRRVSLITVEVITPFNGAATLSIGYHVNNLTTPQPPVPAGLMTNGLIDLTVAGTYTTSTDILFGIDTVSGDVTITSAFVSGGSSLGEAQIIVSYV